MKSTAAEGSTYTIALTDGTFWDITAPRGAKGDTGATGQGIELVGVCPTETALRSEHPVGARGEVYAVGSADDYIIYVWDGSDWSSAGHIRGAKGDTGATGPAGPTGADGADGADATINGVNTLTLTAGDNIALSQTGSTLTISSTCGEINRTNAVNAANTAYTTLMARGEKLLDAATFDAVTDWSAQLVNGAIAWRYE